MYISALAAVHERPKALHHQYTARIPKDAGLKGFKTCALNEADVLDTLDSAQLPVQPSQQFDGRCIPWGCVACHHTHFDAVTL